MSSNENSLTRVVMVILFVLLVMQSNDKSHASKEDVAGLKERLERVERELDHTKIMLARAEDEEAEELMNHPCER